MKKVLALVFLFLGACSTQDKVDSQEAMRGNFIRTVQSMNLYWVDYPAGTVSSIRLIMADNGEIPDPIDIRMFYTIDSMINSTTAGYKFTQYYADDSSQSLYAVLFIGQDSTRKRSLARGNFLSVPPLPTVPITSTTPADIIEWKTFHKAVFVKGNFSITRGLPLAVEE